MPAEREAEADAAARARRLGAWLAGYQPVPGAADELIGPDGRPRAHWLALLDTFAGLGEIGIEQRFAAAGRRINDMGLAYRAAGETRERSWPISRLPLLLAEAEWAEIAAGVAQRAELFDKVLLDIYGPARLVADGALPAAAVAGSPEFVRALCGTKPAGGRWLRFYAADIGRGPDGKWWVLGDRAQAPSGAGYALENRLILSRTFPSLYRDMKTRRLAPFFREFRAGLAAASPRVEPRICLMTPGPFSETYAEQVSLARYLGFLLVEGEDLVAANGALHVRTIAGLKRADVLWRRVDAEWLDPLELNAASRLGVPGLVDVIRRGEVLVANMPGAGLIESRALMSFMPALAKKVLGEDLRLANIATWWGGQDRERREILATLEERAISGAFVYGTPGFSENSVALGAELDAASRARLVAALETRGMDYVGQEIVRLSTTPAWRDGKITPRPFALRVFAAATPNGWVVMPGGFCRVSDRLDVRAVSMGSGAQSADVWVLGERPAEKASLLPPANEAHIVRVLGSLPSRAADNLFWMGRYLERAEATLRVVRAICNRLTEPAAAEGERQPIERCARLLIAWGAAPADGERRPAAVIALRAASDCERYGSALSIMRSAKRSASIIRERLSQDVWQLLAQLETRLECVPTLVRSEPELLEETERALHTLAAISGLADENFNRVAGWSFLDLGKRVERAINTCRFARQFADADATIETLDALLELIDSQITYRSRYLSGTALAPVLDMAMLDPFNPRSVGFQAARVDERLASLPSLREDGVLETPRRLALRICAELESEDARKIDATRILSFEQRLMSLAEEVAARYFATGASAPRASERFG